MNDNCSTQTIYQLKIYLEGISPMIWRRIRIKANTSITELHYILQLIMRWEDIHLNCFKIHGKSYGVYHSGGMSFSDNPIKVCFAELGLRVGWKFTYEYDFIRWWVHQIRVEKILPLDASYRHPVCLGGVMVLPS